MRQTDPNLDESASLRTRWHLAMPNWWPFETILTGITICAGWFPCRLRSCAARCLLRALRVHPCHDTRPPAVF